MRVNPLESVFWDDDFLTWAQITEARTIPDPDTPMVVPVCVGPKIFVLSMW